MFSEAYGGLLIGSLLTLTISIVTMFLTNHFSINRWNLEKQYEQTQYAIEQLYSPLYFYFDELRLTLAFLCGILVVLYNDKKHIKLNEDDLKAIQTKALNISSKTFIELIKNKLGILKPSQFRNDLLEFEKFLINLEYQLTLAKYFKPRETRVELHKLMKVLCYFDHILIHFQGFLENEILGKEADLKNLQYTKFINTKRKRLFDKLFDLRLKNIEDDKFITKLKRETKKELVY